MSDTASRHMGVRAVLWEHQNFSTPIGLVRKDKENLSYYLLLGTPFIQRSAARSAARSDQIRSRTVVGLPKVPRLTS